MTIVPQGARLAGPFTVVSPSVTALTCCTSAGPCQESLNM